MPNTAEHKRLAEYRNRESNWKHWGPYLSERAWGTVREDYSPYGSAWDYFPHDHARSRAYRWNEDGLAGISDRNQYMCFALALWNGKDAILKERLFGLTGPEGNHGEDVKEYYYYLDSTPTHSYMRMLYKYPQAAFPYGDLVQENRRRGHHDDEYELVDTGIFDDGRYFDVLIDYAKGGENDILVKIEVVNRGEDSAEIHLLPTLWFRNTWSWGYENGPMGDVPGKPQLFQSAPQTVQADHPCLGSYYLHADGADNIIFTENETNNERLFGAANASPRTKDAFHRYIINGDANAIDPDKHGTKCAALYRRTVPAGESVSIRLRLTTKTLVAPFQQFNTLYKKRYAEAGEFYASIQNQVCSDDERRVQRQAYAGMLWSKQLFYYDINQWLDGDPGTPAPPESRKTGRNNDWRHLHNFDIISMPDKWEYPWYAAWDLAFHCIPLVLVDPEFAKRQLILMTREWYLHPNGQMPAYEWAFGDVNPPVHAWGAWRVYKIDAKQSGKPDRAFLEAVFHKLLLNFTWWVNRKDKDGNNVFQGGFLGLDNISLFDRSAELPTGGHIDQADGTSWMAFYSLIMLRIALELAKDNPVYQDLATKFYEHFLAIATQINFGFDGHGLWDDTDGFYYDVLHTPDGRKAPLRVRSLVGLMALLATETLDPEIMEQMAIFTRRMDWFVKNRPHLATNIADSEIPGEGRRRLLAILTRERLASILRYMLDENEFLSPYGIRSLSKIHETPYELHIDGETFSIAYQPAESRSGLFGGNSNWRGPIWFPLNYILIESLQKFHHYYGDDFTVELPTGSGNWVTLDKVAQDLSQRLTRIFTRNPDEQRAVYGQHQLFQNDPAWRDLILFYEFFHGDTGRGLGASHQTGWTGLVAKLIQQAGGK